MNSAAKPAALPMSSDLLDASQVDALFDAYFAELDQEEALAKGEDRLTSSS